MKQESRSMQFSNPTYKKLVILLVALWLLGSCSSTERRLTKSVNKQLTVKHAYFKKIVAIETWHSNDSGYNGYSWADAYYYETAYAAEKGFLDLVATKKARDDYNQHDGVKLNYTVAKKAKPYLVSILYDSSRKKQVAIFNAYRLKKVLVDSFYHPYPQSQNGYRTDESKMIVQLKCTYDIAPLFKAKNNYGRVLVWMETQDQGKTWNIMSKAKMIVEVYSPLGMGGYLYPSEMNLILPEQLKTYLLQYWRPEYFRNFK